MEYIEQHALGLIIVALLSYNTYQKHMMMIRIEQLFTEKIEKPVKADLKIQAQVEKKMDAALEVKPYDEVIAERNKL